MSATGVPPATGAAGAACGARAAPAGLPLLPPAAGAAAFAVGAACPISCGLTVPLIHLPEVILHLLLFAKLVGTYL